MSAEAVAEIQDAFDKVLAFARAEHDAADVARDHLEAVTFRAEAAEADLAAHLRAEAAREQARSIIAESPVQIGRLAVKGLMAALPLTNAGDLDEVAFATTFFDYTKTLLDQGSRRI